MKGDLNVLDNKIDDNLNKLYGQYICLLSDSDIAEKESVRANFVKQEKMKISGTLLMLSKKVLGFYIQGATQRVSA